MKQEKLTMALPKGEFQKPVLQFMGDMGFDYDASNPRSLRIPVTNFPVEFVLIRASSVPEYLSDTESESRIGITGSDILWNAGFGKEAGEEVPIYDYYENLNNPTLYLGVTNEFAEEVTRNELRNPQLSDLSGYMLATKYENIAKEYLSSESTDDVEIRYVPGSDEAVQYLIPRCVSILGLCDTGRTLEANDIEVLDKFYTVTLRLITDNLRLSPQEISIIDEIREKIAVAMERRRVV